MKRFVLILTTALLWSINSVSAHSNSIKNKVYNASETSVNTDTGALNNTQEIQNFSPVSNVVHTQSLRDIPGEANRKSIDQIRSSFEENSYKTTLTAASFSNPIQDNSGSGFIYFQQAQIFSNGIFYGLIIMLVLINVFCMVLFRDQIFGLFALGMTVMGTLIFQFDGYIALFTLSLGQNTVLEAVTLWALIAVVSLFAHRYLLAKEYAPNIKILTGILLGLSLSAIGFYVFVETELYLQIAQVILMALVARYVLLGITRAKESGYAKLFTVALLPFYLILVDQLVYNQLGMSLFGLSDGLLKISAIIFVLTMTYGLFYRMQSLKGQHDLRQLEMRIFMNRQEAFQARAKTERLVEDLYLENLIMQYDLDGFEIKLLQYISEGKTNAVIAKKMKTTIEDIEDRTKALYQKLDIAEQVREDQNLLNSQPDYLYN